MSTVSSTTTHDRSDGQDPGAPRPSREEPIRHGLEGSSAHPGRRADRGHLGDGLRSAAASSSAPASAADDGWAPAAAADLPLCRRRRHPRPEQPEPDELLGDQRDGLQRRGHRRHRLRRRHLQPGRVAHRADGRTRRPRRVLHQGRLAGLEVRGQHERPGLGPDHRRDEPVRRAAASPRSTASPPTGWSSSTRSPARSTRPSARRPSRTSSTRSAIERRTPASTPAVTSRSPATRARRAPASTTRTARSPVGTPTPTPASSRSRSARTSRASSSAAASTPSAASRTTRWPAPTPRRARSTRVRQQPGVPGRIDGRVFSSPSPRTTSRPTSPSAGQAGRHQRREQVRGLQPDHRHRDVGAERP